ncbi:MAG: phage tail assembly chaperone [Pseudomonadota bacterium]
MQRFAFGCLHWTPDVFWSATLNDILAAINGWNDAQGGSTKRKPMTRSDLNDLIAHRAKLDRKAKHDN